MFEGSVVYAVEFRRNRFIVAILPAYCRKARAVRRVRNRHRSVVTHSTNHATNVCLAVYRYAGCNCTIRNRVAAVYKPNDTANRITCCVDCDIAYGAVHKRTVHIRVAYDTANEAITVDIRTIVCFDCAILHCDFAFVHVTDDTTHAIYERCVHLDITLYGDVFKRCAVCLVNKACNDPYVECIACDVCRVNRYVFDREISDRHRTVNVAEQTAAYVVVAILEGLDVQVLNRVAVTIEVAIERPFVAITDALRPNCIIQIDVCAKSHPHAGCVVLRCAAVHAFTEKFHVCRRVDYERIFFRTFPTKAFDNAERTIFVCFHDHIRRNVFHRNLIEERTARYNGCTSILVERAAVCGKIRTARHRYVCAFFHIYVEAVVIILAVKRTAVDDRRRVLPRNHCVRRRAFKAIANKRTAVNRQRAVVAHRRMYGRERTAVNRDRTKVINRKRVVVRIRHRTCVDHHRCARFVANRRSVVIANILGIAIVVHRNHSTAVHRERCARLVVNPKAAVYVACIDRTRRERHRTVVVNTAARKDTSATCTAVFNRQRTIVVNRVNVLRGAAFRKRSSHRVTIQIDDYVLIRTDFRRTNKLYVLFKDHFVGGGHFDVESTRIYNEICIFQRFRQIKFAISGQLCVDRHAFRAICIVDDCGTSLTSSFYLHFSHSFLRRDCVDDRGGREETERNKTRNQSEFQTFAFQSKFLL